jgi:uncharacterized protein (DUF305 family)
MEVDSTMEQKHGKDMTNHHYWMLGLSTALSAVVMYLSMYAMIDTLQSFYNNINQVYMALMMAAPMVVIMLLTMRSMYPNAALNTMLYAGSVLVFLLSFAAIRYQVPVGDRQFLRSMIPHHSGAIVMCEQAKLSNPEIKGLCTQIIKSQREEIAQMRSLLRKR